MRRPLTGFPRQLTMSHKYVENVQVSSSTGIMGKYLWSCNGLYDPNITGGGHQPMYFDQLAALYDHYVVTQSKIQVWIQTQTAASTGFICGININDDATVTGTSATETAESAQSTLTVVGYAPSAPKYMTATWNAKKVFAGDPLTNTELQGTSAANPTEVSNYVVFWQHFNSTVAVAVDIVVQITYTATWKELKDISAS